MANNPTSSTIEQYREAKSNYLKLKNQAKKELVARFNALAAELLQVQRELLEDFGEKVSLPTKASALKKKTSPTSTTVALTAEPSPVDTAKAASLVRQLDRQKKKKEDLKAAGKPTKAVDDRIYELEDEIRLLQ